MHKCQWITGCKNASHSADLSIKGARHDADCNWEQFVCGAQFLNAKDHDKHLEMIHLNNPYEVYCRVRGCNKCVISQVGRCIKCKDETFSCDLPYKDKGKMVRHVKQKHYEEKEKCEFCGKELSFREKEVKHKCFKDGGDGGNTGGVGDGECSALFSDDLTYEAKLLVAWANYHRGK